MSRLSRCFQLTDCDYSIIPRMLKVTVESLEQLKTSDGINLRGMQQFLDQLRDAGIELQRQNNLSDDYFTDSIKIPFLSNLIKNLQDRFDDKSAIAAFDVFNPAKLPPLLNNPSNIAEFNEYGNQQIEELSKQYQELLPVKHREVVSDLCVNPTITAIFPIMSVLAKICRVVPVHTADVERTFSQMKLIKTRIRNRMQEKTLDSLLRIAIEGPTIEQFPVQEVVTVWAQKKKRRLS